MASSVGFGNAKALSISFSSPPSAGIKFPSSSFSTAHHSVTIKKPRISTGSFKSYHPKNTFTGSDSPFGGVKKPSTPGALTPQEAFALGYQQGHHSSSGSFLDQAKHFGGSVLSDAINVISRPNWGVARGYDLATKHGGFDVGAFMHGFKQGAIDGKAETFGQILARRNPHANGLLTGAAGLGLDVVTDPTTYLFGAGAFKDIGKFGVTKGLSELETKGAAKMLGKELAPVADNATAAEKAAHESVSVLHNRIEDLKYKNARNKYLELRVGPTKKYSIGIQTPIRLSKSKDAKLAAMAEGAGGPISKVKNALGEAFVPGYSNPVGHLIENHVGHHIERAGDVMMQDMLHHLKPGVKALHSTGDQLKALLAGVTPGAVRHGKLQEDVLVHALGQHGFQPHQIDNALKFLHSFHDAGRSLLAHDRAAGLTYKDVGAGENGIMYVPHVYEKSQQAANIVRAQSVLGHQGFENAKKLTLEQALKANAAGHGKNLITDPIELMARRVHAGAMGQGQQLMRDYIRKNFGVADKVLGSPEHVAKAMGRVARLHGEVQMLHDALDQHGSLYNAQRRLRYAHGKQKVALENALKGIKKRDIATRNGKYREFAAEAKDVQKRMAEIRGKVAAEGRKHSKSEALTLARLTRRHNLLTAEMKNHESLAVMKARHVEEANALGLQHATRAHELQTAIDSRMKQINKLEPAALRKAFVKNPALKGKQLIKIDHLKTKQDLSSLKAQVGNVNDYSNKLAEVASLKEGKKGLTINYHVPPEIHAAVTRVEAVLHDPQQMGKLVETFRKALSKWKLYVTMANPGYGLRNTMSDMWNAYIRGMPLWAMPVYAAKAAKLMRAAHNGDAKAIATLDTAAYHGILTGFYNTDIREALKGGVTASKLNIVRHMTTGNIARENGGRLAHYLYRIQHEGMSPEAAANEIRVAHFDYTDLTPFEKKHMKNIAPFYTWTRKNVPLQLQQLIARPGRYSAYEKAANESEQATGVKPGELAATVFQSHPMAFKTPFGYFDPNVGISDLARIQDPTQLLQMVNPAIQVPMEIGLNQDFFTGQAISGPDAPHQLTPAPGLLADLLGPLGLSGETGRVVQGGKEVHSPGINNLAALVMDQIPLGSEIMSHNKIQDYKAQPYAKLGGFSIGPRDVSYGAGLSFTRPNQAEEALIAQLDAQKAQQAALKALREAGKYPQAKKHKQSAFQKEMAALIQRQMGR